MDELTVKIYSSEAFPRLKYIAGIIIGDILGLPFEIITDRRKLGKHPVINYSDEAIAGAFRISPVPLLFESGIKPVEINMSSWKNLPVFFQTSPESDLPFDIFAASFYLVSRYEEYLEFRPDGHGRFSAAASLAYKNGFLGIPVIDHWTKELSKALIRKYPRLTFRRNEFRALLTVDTDEPFAYLGKNVIRSVGGMLRDLTKNKEHAGNRYKVVKHEMKDPYQVFDYMTGIIEKCNIETRFFFPVCDYSKFDKNPSWKNDAYRDLIKTIAGKYSFGIHPGYYASSDKKQIRSEIGRLKAIVSKEVCASRFHFLRLFIPDSYRNLCNEGITQDFTMGYADEPGFRAGIARPFYFYDAALDRQTELRVVPFQYMDVTLSRYKKLEPQAALEVVNGLINETRMVGGLFSCIWHNTSLLEGEEWKGWRNLFESMMHSLRK